MLMLRACAALAKAPACADKIAVRPRPRLATATITSSKVNPPLFLTPARFILKPRVLALGRLGVVARPRHRELAFSEIGLARQGRHDERHRVRVDRRVVD